MERDYEKDNFTELDKFLYEVADKHNRKLSGSMTDFIGCTKSEIKDILLGTVSRMVSSEEMDMYEKQINYLIA